MPSLAPRRLALLAILAAAGRRGISRDRVIGILWPEAGPDQARHALAQACYSLKQATGRDWIAPGPELRLDAAITSDIEAWQEALAAGDHEEVVRRYTAPFLDGFYLTGAPEFERWVEGERARMHQAVLRAAEQLAAGSAQSAPSEDPLQWWRRLTELDPLSARYAMGYMQALAASGDRTSALDHGRRYQRHVRDELDAEPDQTVQALVERLRVERPLRAGSPAVTHLDPVPVTGDEPAMPGNVRPAPASHAPPAPRRLVSRLVAGVALLVVLVAVTVQVSRYLDRLPSAPATDTMPGVGTDPISASANSTLASHAIESVSAEARLLYDQGLEAHFRNDGPGTYRSMSAALERDSMFAMAAYYAWQNSLALPDRAAAGEALDRVKRLADRAVDRERLTMQASVAAFEGPITRAVAIAETLAVRYPDDPDGQLLLGQMRFLSGDWAGAVAAASRAVAVDTPAPAPEGRYCRSCVALGLMSDVFIWWDSAGAAERVARQLVSARPASADSWHYLIEPLLRQGRRTEAEAVVQRMEALMVGPVVPSPKFNRDLIRWGRLEEADRVLSPDLNSPASDIRREARWLLILSLRDQGRLAEALALARDGMIPGREGTVPDLPQDPVAIALVEVEAGRHAVAARMFRREAEQVLGATGAPLAVRARGGSWYLTLAGVAHGMAGDTAQLRRLADSVEVIGRGSGFGRDQRLHLVLRGLLWQLQGHHEEAIDAFRRSLFSLSDGYTRTNLMLARSLLALRRPAEAIDVLRPALRGGVDGSNTHVSRTELHAALADAFEQAGAGDSARVHRALVERAWRQADPTFQSRYQRARIAAARQSP